MTNKKNSFCKIPKVLYFNDAMYNALSLGAVVVYCFMLERRSLSCANSKDWTDSKGEVFIHFSREDVEYFAKCKHDKASRIFRELEAARLIRRVHQGLGHPDRVYVYDLPNRNSGYAVVQQKSKCDTNGDVKTDSKQSVLPMSVNPDCSEDGDGFSDTNNNEQINTDSKKTLSKLKREDLREVIRKKIDYEDLSLHYPASQVNFLVEVICDTISCLDKVVYISGSMFEGSYVRERLSNLTRQEAEYALQLFGMETDTIRSPKRYILTRLWEAQAGVVLKDVLQQKSSTNSTKQNSCMPSGTLGEAEMAAIRAVLKT